MRAPNLFLVSPVVPVAVLRGLGIQPADDEPEQLIVCNSGASYPNVTADRVMFMAKLKGPHTRAEMVNLCAWLKLVLAIEQSEIDDVYSGIVADHDELAKTVGQ